MDCAFNMFVWLFLVFMGHWSIVSAGFFSAMIRTSSGEDLLWFLCLCPGHSKSKRNQLVRRAKNYGACMGGFHVLFSEAYAMPKEGDTEHVQAI